MILFRFLHINVSIAVTDAGRGAKDNRRGVFLREGKGLLYHIIRLLYGRRVEQRQLGVCRKGTGILLGLRRDGTRIIRNHDDHAAFDTDISQTHQRIRGHIQAYLLHGDHGAHSGIGSSGSHLHSSFFVDRPFYIGLRGAAPGDGLQYFGGRCAGITCDNTNPGSQCSHGNGFVAH